MVYFHEIRPSSSETTQTTDFKKYPHSVSLRREFKIKKDKWNLSIVDLNEEDSWCNEYCIGQFVFDIMIVTNNGEGMGRIAARFTAIEDSVAFLLTFK